MKSIKIISLLVLLFTILSRLFGFVREIGVASFFGVNHYTDIFFVILIFPIMLSQIIGSNLSVKLIGDLKKEENKMIKQTIDKYFYNGLIIFSIVSLGIFIFNIITVEVPSNSNINSFLWISNISLSISTLFWGMSYLNMGILQADSKFIVCTIAPLLSNVISIIIMFFFQKVIYSIPIAFTISSIVQMVFVSIFIKGHRSLSFSLFRKNFDAQIFKNIIVMVLSSFALQLPLIMERYIVLRLGEGYVTILNLAQKVYQLPTNIIISSLISMIFPLLLRLNGNRRYSNLLIKTIVNICIISAPIISIIYISSPFLVDTFFGKSIKDQEQLNELAMLIKVFGISTALYIIRDLLLKLLFSLDYLMVTIKISIVTTIINIALDIVMIYFFGIIGIPIALIFSLIIFVVLSMKFMNKRGPISKKKFVSFLDFKLVYNVISIICVILLFTNDQIIFSILLNLLNKFKGLKDLFRFLFFE